MTEAFRCPYCDATSSPQAQFCATCGRNLAIAPAYPAAPAPATPAAGVYGVPLSAGGPPSMFGAARPQAAVVAPGAAKPMGILLVTVFVAIVSAVGLFVTWDYAYWMNWRFTYDESFWGIVDAAFGLGFVITSIYGFAIVPKLWSLQPPAWSTANWLCVAWLALIGGGILVWSEVSLMSIVGIVVVIGVLAYLNYTPVRALFGRAPLATFGPASDKTAG